ncbi:MAG TPA: DUF1489 family protein, partial [Beijerinckia sp.]|nr:DUF1489 family protein [Beijerinckia sp.]
MALHLLKLCVGIGSLDELKAWGGRNLAARRQRGEPEEHVHTTRLMPKRTVELLDGGSLYWVIKGEIAARQALIDVRPFTDSDGIGRCQLVLDPVIIPVVPRPFRAFQGWRYLEPGACPPDL